MHRFFVSQANTTWATSLVRTINLESVRLDLPLDARMGLVEGEIEERWPYAAYMEIERTDTAQMLSPGAHFEGFALLAERLRDLDASGANNVDEILVACGLHHDPAPTRSVISR